MPGAGGRRVSNGGGCTNANIRLSGRKRVQTGKTCETVVASKPRGGGKRKGSLQNKRQRNDNTDDEEGDDKDEEELALTQVPNTYKGTLGINNNRANTMNGMSVSTEPLWATKSACCGTQTAVSRLAGKVRWMIWWR
jgi:hypothetical protein